jgi:hypothetical protein
MFVHCNRKVQLGFVYIFTRYSARYGKQAMPAVRKTSMSIFYIIVVYLTVNYLCTYSYIYML